MKATHETAETLSARFFGRGWIVLGLAAAAWAVPIGAWFGFRAVARSLIG